MTHRYYPVIEALLNFPVPAVRYKVRVGVLGEDPGTAELSALQAEIASSPLVTRLLAGRDAFGEIRRSPYEKWRGAHWVLTVLAGLDYPPGDASLLPLRDQVYRWIFSDEIQIRQTARIKGLYRRHASQEGNILYTFIRLGLGDAQLDRLAANLLRYQWPDGGWNCDKRPQAHTSTFTHSIFALRGLLAYQKWKADVDVAASIQAAKEFFLSRHLCRRMTNGEIIRPEYLLLTYPDYHFYTFLVGLKAMAEGGWLDDPRCQDALDLLETKFIPQQGWKLEKKYYHTSQNNKHRCSAVPWAQFKLGRAHGLLTADALAVLQQAGRLD